MRRMAQVGIVNSRFVVCLLMCFILVGCTQDEKPSSSEKSKQAAKPEIKVPDFNADSSYFFIEQQLSFGPRVPNTEGHKKCGDFLISTLKQYADTVIVQKTTMKAFNNVDLKLRNIIASWNPLAQRRVLLCAHWDTRPFADQDEDRPGEPIMGANDGGSGVAVLLELARMFEQTKPHVGIDIILFDGEDYGQPDNSPFPRMEDSYCLGSQYWAENPHQKRYYADFGILLDMVGAKDAKFTMEGTSRYFASSYLKKVWETAYSLGYSNYFQFTETKAIVDDHLYINRIANIPTIDIVEYDPATKSNFGSYWHTHEDDIELIDKQTLKAVGETVAHVIYKY